MDDETEDYSSDGPLGDSPSLRELEHLHSRLSAAEREELLECLLIAAPKGGGAMIKVLEDLLMYHATDEMLEQHGELD